MREPKQREPGGLSAALGDQLVQLRHRVDDNLQTVKTSIGLSFVLAFGVLLSRSTIWSKFSSAAGFPEYLYQRRFKFRARLCSISNPDKSAGLVLGAEHQPLLRRLVLPENRAPSEETLLRVRLFGIQRNTDDAERALDSLLAEGPHILEVLGFDPEARAVVAHASTAGWPSSRRDLATELVRSRAAVVKAEAPPLGSSGSLRSLRALEVRLRDLGRAEAEAEALAAGVARPTLLRRAARRAWAALGWSERGR